MSLFTDLLTLTDQQLTIFLVVVWVINGLLFILSISVIREFIIKPRKKKSNCDKELERAVAKHFLTKKLKELQKEVSSLFPIKDRGV